MKNTGFLFVMVFTLLTLAKANAQNSTTFTDAEGKKWTGTKVNGKWHGKVTLNYPNGHKSIVTYKNGEIDGPIRYTAPNFSIIANVDDQLRIHDSAGRYQKIGSPFVFIFHYHQGKIKDRIAIEDRNLDRTLYAKFDTTFRAIDGMVEYRYINAVSKEVSVKGTFKDNMPEGKFVASYTDRVIDSGFYSKAKLIRGSEVLGVHNSNTYLITKKVQSDRYNNKLVADIQKTNSDNNNKGFDLGLGNSPNSQKGNFDKDIVEYRDYMMKNLAGSHIKFAGDIIAERGPAVVSGAILAPKITYHIVVVSKSNAQLKKVRVDKLSSPGFSTKTSKKHTNGIIENHYSFTTFDRQWPEQKLYVETTGSNSTVLVLVYYNTKF